MLIKNKNSGETCTFVQNVFDAKFYETLHKWYDLSETRFSRFRNLNLTSKFLNNLYFLCVIIFIKMCESYYKFHRQSYPCKFCN